MNLICPQCNQPIGQDDFNVGTDIAYCRRCDATFSVATLVAVETVDDASYEAFEQSCCEELGRGKMATVPFHVANRILGGVFVLDILVLPIAFGVFFASKEHPEPFIILSAILWGINLLFVFLLALFFCAGKYKAKVEDGSLRVQTGIFPVRRRRQIDLSRKTSVHMEKNFLFVMNSRPLEQIIVETESRRIAFGILLSGKNKMCLMKWLAAYVN